MAVAADILNMIHNGMLGIPAVLQHTGLRTTKGILKTLGISRFRSIACIISGLNIPIRTIHDSQLADDCRQCKRQCFSRGAIPSPRKPINGPST